MTHDEFIDAVLNRTQLDDRDQAADVVSAVLKTFSEVLYRTERDGLAAPLPKPLAHYLHADERQNTRRETERFSAEEFLNRVEARTNSNLSMEEARTYATAVFGVLTDAIGESLLSDAAEQLPEDYGALFPFQQNPESSSSSPT